MKPLRRDAVVTELTHRIHDVDALSEWECSDCGAVFGYGPGTPGHCPHCGEPLAKVDLLETAQEEVNL